MQSRELLGSGAALALLFVLSTPANCREVDDPSPPLTRVAWEVPEQLPGFVTTLVDGPGGVRVYSDLPDGLLLQLWALDDASQPVELLDEAMLTAGLARLEWRAHVGGVGVDVMLDDRYAPLLRGRTSPPPPPEEATGDDDWGLPNMEGTGTPGNGQNGHDSRLGPHTVLKCMKAKCRLKLFKMPEMTPIPPSGEAITLEKDDVAIVPSGIFALCSCS